ncbi:DUF320-domain-containing protein [Conidiobolus coronatus NRRL 28638]|uniref:DUF320-domain-containing protein n=1 Tax=Conidiobolus coronatus (strain ATCC 28846 / CBS 209.66 / NRRL 28638) TaxID=796925 RepID=A0A137NZS5_CONC2|nr:DUF320-domain-containing protein [Conidiobolus coronatus NRRL 28638]|eukprot:KXN68208.1 DUF320-domain-containing protein [Conidiobolus coronatus NRRL 28638]
MKPIVSLFFIISKLLGYPYPGTGSHGEAIGSPGVLSGNVIQVPVHVPVNVCGNSINVIGLLNPAFGNTCYALYFQ